MGRKWLYVHSLFWVILFIFGCNQLNADKLNVNIPVSVSCTAPMLMSYKGVSGLESEALRVSIIFYDAFGEMTTSEGKVTVTIFGSGKIFYSNTFTIKKEDFVITRNWDGSVQAITCFLGPIEYTKKPSGGLGGVKVEFQSSGGKILNAETNVLF